MAGKIKQMIDSIVTIRSKGDETVANLTRTKIILKGVNIKNYTESSADDPIILTKIQLIAKEMGVAV